jgi:hypothetical protein
VNFASMIRTGMRCSLRTRVEKQLLATRFWLLAVVIMKFFGELAATG